MYYRFQTFCHRLPLKPSKFCDKTDENNNIIPKHPSLQSMS